MHSLRVKSDDAKGNARLPKAPSLHAARIVLGVGLVEFLVALFIFSAVATAVLAAQLAGKSLHFDALQRSLATAMANDLLVRIQSNRAGLAAYVTAGAAGLDQTPDTPGLDCRASDCSADQLAAYDLWQWWREVQGAMERRSGVAVGGLLSPAACVREQAGIVSVVITWQGTSRTGGEIVQESCVADGSGAHAGEEPALPGSRPRHHIVLSTFVGVGA